MHAEGDTQIPSDHSEELYERAGEPRKLIIAPGGAHTTVQHDPELQSVALRWLERRARGGTRRLAVVVMWCECEQPRRSRRSADGIAVARGVVADSPEEPELATGSGRRRILRIGGP